MDWAVGLAANSGRLVAEIVGADDTVDLAVLQTRGVPADRAARRRRSVLGRVWNR